MLPTKLRVGCLTHGASPTRRTSLATAAIMTDDSEHSASVNAWLERGPKDLTGERLMTAFATALEAIWQRARETLGDVTLTAIAERVVYVAAEQHPVCASLKVDDTGIRFDQLRERADNLPQASLAEGLRFVLVELMTVLGNLTAEILTPGLHAALAKVDAPKDSES